MSTFSVLLLCILLIILMIFPNIQKLIGKFNIIIVCYNSNSSYNSLLIIYFLTFPSSEVLNFKGCWMSCKVLVWDQLGPSSRGHARELGVFGMSCNRRIYDIPVYQWLNHHYSPFITIVIPIWLVVTGCHLLFSHINWVSIIIPIDELLFFRGLALAHQPAIVIPNC